VHFCCCRWPLISHVQLSNLQICVTFASRYNQTAAAVAVVVLALSFYYSIRLQQMLNFFSRFKIVFSLSSSGASGSRYTSIYNHPRLLLISASSLGLVHHLDLVAAAAAAAGLQPQVNLEDSGIGWETWRKSYPPTSSTSCQSLSCLRKVSELHSLMELKELALKSMTLAETMGCFHLPKSVA
jgi:hypothetical protein